MCVLASVCASRGGGWHHLSSFILLLTVCVVLRQIHTHTHTHVHIVNLPVYLPHKKKIYKSTNLTRSPKMSSRTPVNLQQINNVCSHNQPKQMSITFPDEKQFAVTCVHSLAQQTHPCACIHKHSVLCGLVCHVISPRGDDTCAACLSGSPWEAGNQ